MNLEYEKQLEAEIERELKTLRSLRAPLTLASRVMAAIEKRTALPWFLRAWPAWPIALRIASLGMMLALFGGLCFGAWELSNAGSNILPPKLGGWLSAIGALGDVVTVLLTAVGSVVRQLGPLFLLGYVAVLTFGYALCLGLGTLGMKVALARR
jgi:hypothetical protein